MQPVPDDDRTPIRVPPSLAGALAICCIVTLVLGVAPRPRRRVRRPRRARARGELRSTSSGCARPASSGACSIGRFLGVHGRGPVRRGRRVLRAGGGGGPQRRLPHPPEVGPLFGAVVARAARRWWRELGEPDPFVVVEAGAGRRHAGPHRARGGARVRAGAALRARRAVGRPAGAAREHLPLDPAVSAFAPDAGRADERRRRPTDGPTGPIVVSLADLPRLAGLRRGRQRAARQPAAFDFRARRRARAVEVHVGLGRLAPGLRPGRLAADADRVDAARPANRCDRAAARRGARRPALVERGRVVVFDYADTTSSLAGRPGPTGSAPTAATSAAERPPRGPRAPRTSRARSASTSFHQRRATARRPTGSRPRHRRARRRGAPRLDHARQRRRPRGDESTQPRLRGRGADRPVGLGAFRVLEWS